MVALMLLSVAVGLSIPSPAFSMYDFDEYILLKKVTVVMLTPGSSGSGAIIGKHGDVYTLLTAAHVIKGLGQGEELFIESLTSGRRYPAISHYTPNRQIDLAIVRFKSREAFNIAPLAAFFPTGNNRSFRKSGITDTWNVARFYGIVYGVSAPTGSTKMRLPRLEKFDLRERASGNQLGLEFVYSASTVPGMSGSPILGDQEWKCLSANETTEISGPIALVAIHARSEEYPGLQSRSGTSLGVPVDLLKNYLKNNAESMGIPVTEQAIGSLIAKQYCPPAAGIVQRQN